MSKIFTVLLFLLVAVSVQIIYYPIGVYDLGNDLWQKANVMMALNDSSSFARDPYLCKITGSRANTEIYITTLFQRYFNSYETYVACIAFLSYFIGLLLLYVVLKRVTGDAFISTIGSILFSSSSVWFPPLGDAFALIPLYSLGGKSISYLWFLFMLVIYFKWQGRRFIDEVIVVLATAIVWIHSITFLGPIVALLIYIVGKTVFKQHWAKALRLTLIGAVLLLPYIFFYLHVSIVATRPLSHAEQMLVEFVIMPNKDMVWYPLSLFKSLEQALFQTNGYALLALVLVLVPFGRPATFKNLALFALLGTLIFPLTLVLKTAGFLSHHEMFFYMLDRNMKWVYFFIFLILLGSYRILLECSTSVQNGSRRFWRTRSWYAIMLLVVFAMPLKMTFASSFGMRGIHKLADLSQRFFPKSASIRQAIGLDTREINNDTEMLAAYIKTRIPPTSGIIGPGWVPYKTGHGLIFEETYVHNLAVFKDIDKLRASLKTKEALAFFETGEETQAMERLKRLGVDYLVIEKFKRDFSRSYVKYVADPNRINFRERFSSYIEFENNNFLLMRTSLKRGI